MFFACELLATYMVVPMIEEGYRDAPAATWLYYLPFNLLIKGSYIGVFFARSRSANLVWLAILILLLGAQYWENGAIGDWVQQRFGGFVGWLRRSSSKPASVGRNGDLSSSAAARMRSAADQQPLSDWIERMRLRPPRFVSLTTALPLQRDLPAE